MVFVSSCFTVFWCSWAAGHLLVQIISAFVSV